MQRLHRIRRSGSVQGTAVGLWQIILLAVSALAPLLSTERDVRAAWWERGAATWYYKDDWKGLALSGGRGFSKQFKMKDPGESGWIVVRGDRGYRLLLSGRLVGESVDGALIDDYDLDPFLNRATEITLSIEGTRICAEGEFVTAAGARIPFATGADWTTSSGGRPRTEKMKVMPSTGAFHRAHNGRLLTYNDEERGKTAIAKTLARVQRLEDQSVFLLRRFRPAEDVLSFDDRVLWRRAEQYALPLAEKARQMVKARAVAAQKAGKYREARSIAAEAGVLLSAAEQAVSTATAVYRAEREIVHLESCADLLARQEDLRPILENLRHLAGDARWSHAREDFSAVEKLTGRVARRASELRARLTAAPDCVTTGSLDEFPESPFGWLNARALMGNDPARWPFGLAPATADYIDLTGQWEFRLDPNNEGLKKKWHMPDGAAAGWHKLSVPGPWERQGFTKDNLESPGDCPFKLPDRRTGDKPYNGFAWYRKELTVPGGWEGNDVVLDLGEIKNWARVFVNGSPLSSGRLDPPAQHTVAGKLLQFGKKNLITVQVYNHNNFGGMTGGPVALYPAGNRPAQRETAGPLSLVQEHTYQTPAGPARQTLLAGALSPGVVVATDGPVLELSGWAAKGFATPSHIRFATADGTAEWKLGDFGRPVQGGKLAENWISLSAPDHAALIILPQRPKEFAWEKNALGSWSLALHYEAGPVRAAVVILPAGTGAERCRWWASALRRYPVAASDVVTVQDDAQPLWRRHSVHYHYLKLGGFGSLEPLKTAPLPMLASFALKHRNPRLRTDALSSTGFESAYAPYLVAEGTDRLAYSAEGVDRSRVMKVIGELFHGKPPAVFQRMADWGADHIRYAWAFHADWDVPLVRHVGGPVIEDKESAWRRLDRVVDDCNAAGMQMMLTWFFNEDSPQADAGGAVRNSTRYWRRRPEAQKNAIELWRRIAQRYADRPEWAISYDFFNEPAYMNRDHWNEIVKEMTAVIRSVDKRHLIVWESGDGWAQPSWCLWMEPSGDPNTLYSFHRYGKHWGYAYDEYYPGYKCTQEAKHFDAWLEAILFSIRHNVPIHCGEFGISMIQPDNDGLEWLDDCLAFFERFGIGWNWWNYSGRDVYRTGLVAGDRVSPHVPLLQKWFRRSGAGVTRRGRLRSGDE